MTLTLGSFAPINSWEPDTFRPTWEGSTEKAFVIDLTTGNRYLNIGEKYLRISSLAMLIPVLPAFFVAIKILKVVSFSHFWRHEEAEKNGYSLPSRLVRCFTDLVLITTSPILLIAMEVSALYGIIRPNDGRKMYEVFARIGLSAQIEGADEYMRIIQNKDNNTAMQRIWEGALSFVSTPLSPLPPYKDVP
jgi:hypothetical protein